MLRSLTTGAALATAAAMVLVGCTPPEPTETTDAEALTDATTTINRFYEVVDAQFAAGAASPDQFLEVAGPDLAASYSSEVQSQIDEGVSSRGTPEVINVEIVGREGTDLLVDFCTDGSTVTTTTPSGPVVGQTVAWSATFSNSSDGELVMSTLDVRGDESLCGP